MRGAPRVILVSAGRSKTATRWLLGTSGDRGLREGGRRLRRRRQGGAEELTPVACPGCCFRGRAGAAAPFCSKGLCKASEDTTSASEPGAARSASSAPQISVVEDRNGKKDGRYGCYLGSTTRQFKEYNDESERLNQRSR